MWMTGNYLQLLTEAQFESGKTEASAANVNLMFYLSDSIKS